MNYKKQSKASGCCLSNGNFHQRCQCKAGISVCKTFCDRDRNCKGYVGKDRSPTYYCQIATTSECPSSHDCTQHDEGAVGHLDEDESCGYNYHGCYIKSRSKFLTLNIKSLSVYPTNVSINTKMIGLLI